MRGRQIPRGTWPLVLLAAGLVGCGRPTAPERTSAEQPTAAVVDERSASERNAAAMPGSEKRAGATRRRGRR